MPSDLSIDFGPVDLCTVDQLVRRFHERGGQPAVSYGIVRDGTLVHAAGFGARALGGAVPDRRVSGSTVPDERTVFRIASMSKSFTAAAIMLLRDAGALALDDPAAQYVPELANWRYGAQGPGLSHPGAITIRNLLTMTAGFPTDDPWGDRQQGLPVEDFRALLASGVRLNWAPGTRFEYSNLGYAILGLIVTAASGVRYDEFVKTRLLAPLGMNRTGFEAAEFPAEELALGYRRGPSGWEELPFARYGAFAPMGGVFSCVADLTTWSAGFAAAFPPGKATDKDTGAHPLAAASRREMQLPQAVTGWRAPDRIPGGPPAAPSYYGFGLFIDEDPALGRVVSHSGGYPGFGSNMRWHPATGVGVIALGNGTYAAMYALAELVLKAVIPRSAAYHVALAPAAGGTGEGGTAEGGGPWPETLAAADAVNGLLTDWDDATADALFSENVALDRPYQERRADLALLRARIGPFTVDPGRPAESDTPAHRRWWLAGERGTVAAAIQLNPQRPPRVQSLAVAIPPAAGSVLARALATVVGWLNGPGDAAWPASLPFAPEADGGLIARRLRMAAAWAGPVTTGAYQAGDGAVSLTVDLAGEHATVTLSLLVNGSTGELRQADVAL